MSIFIQNVNIKNYKCFSSHEFCLNSPNGTPGSGLNVVIGENGNGKTCLLEAINYISQSSFVAENRLSINDFQDHREPIEIKVSTTDFSCDMPDIYHGGKFGSDGIIFTAKSRYRKSPGKLLSSPLTTSSHFLTTESTYYRNNGSNSGNQIPPYATLFSQGVIQGDDLNIVYFDKNRTRQISNGTYKTTFERICDDLNWKFIKNLKESDASELLNNVSGEYFASALRIAQKGTGRKLADEMSEFFEQEHLKNLRIDLIDILHPFTKAFFTVRPDDQFTQIAPKDLGSGVEIMLTLFLLRSVATESKEGLIYLIDEPELHLHPRAQDKLAKLLIEESSNAQIVVSTHSPYLISNFMSSPANKIILNRGDDGIEIQYADSSVTNIFDWSPSWGEINYRAYGMATVEFHNELYGWLQQKHSLSVTAVDTYLLNNHGIAKSKEWVKENNNISQPPQQTTLCSYVRNSIHHPENKHNEKYSDVDLLNSIDILISVIKK